MRGGRHELVGLAASECEGSKLMIRQGAAFTANIRRQGRPGTSWALRRDSSSDAGLLVAGGWRRRSIGDGDGRGWTRERSPTDQCCRLHVDWEARARHAPGTRHPATRTGCHRRCTWSMLPEFHPAPKISPIASFEKASCSPGPWARSLTKMDKFPSRSGKRCKDGWDLDWPKVGSLPQSRIARTGKGIGQWGR